MIISTVILISVISDKNGCPRQCNDTEIEAKYKYRRKHAQKVDQMLG